MKSITETIISLRPLHDTFVVQHGVGFNWFDYLGMGGSYAYAKNHYDLGDSTHPSLDDEEGWNLVIEQLDLLRPGFIRFGLPPDPHCRPDGTFQGGTPHLERLRRLDAWAQKSGCTIMLDTFLLPEAHVFPADDVMWGKYPTGQFQYAARDNHALARKFLVPLLKHVTLDLGLASVRWFNIINEPFCYGVFETPATLPMLSLIMPKCIGNCARPSRNRIYPMGESSSPGSISFTFSSGRRCRS